MKWAGSQFFIGPLFLKKVVHYFVSYCNDLSQSLLEAPQADSELNRTEEDFIQQNQIIDQELKKYDKLLETCPMLIFKILAFIYMAILSFGLLLILVFFVLVLREPSALGLMICLIMLLFVVFLCVSIFGCALLLGALSSKDLFKVERCIYLSKILFILSMLFFLENVGAHLYNNSIEDKKALLTACLGPPVISIINFGTAQYVKRVILKRNVFQHVSSYPENAA